MSHEAQNKKECNRLADQSLVCLIFAKTVYFRVIGVEEERRKMKKEEQKDERR